MSNTINKSKYLVAGRITGIYSFRGEVKIFHECDSAEFFKKIKSFYFNRKIGENEIKENDVSKEEKVEVESVKVVKNSIAVKFRGIDTEDDAKKLIGKKLYFDKSKVKLSDDTFFIDDLLGLGVFDADNIEKKYGVLSEVFDNGAQLVFAVDTDTQADTHIKTKQILIPNVKQFVKKISVSEGIFVKLIDGMIERLDDD